MSSPDLADAALPARALLADHHEKLEQACFLLRAVACTDDPLELIARYRNLERAVLAHMEAEDELLPSYERADPSDAWEIRAVHEELRRQLYKLGVEVELHCVRLEAIDQLIAILRVHAEHEDRTLYPWLQREVPDHRKRALRARIESSLHELFSFAAGRSSGTTADSSLQ